MELSMSKCKFKDENGNEWEILEVYQIEKNKFYKRKKIGKKYNVEIYAGDHLGMNDAIKQNEIFSSLKKLVPKSDDEINFGY